MIHPMLRMNTLHCPKDGKVLSFEVWGTMRVKHKDPESYTGYTYNARCDHCDQYYTVRAPSEPKE